MQAHVLKLTLLLAGMAALPALAMTTSDNASRSPVSKAAAAPPTSRAAQPAASAPGSREQPVASAPTSHAQPVHRSSREATPATKPAN